MMFYGYIDRTDDGIAFYVGIGSDYRRRALKRNPKHRWVREHHGIKRDYDAFVSSDWEACKRWEIDTIAELHTFIHDPEAHPFACNFTRGGEGTLGCTFNRGRSMNKGRKRPDLSAYNRRVNADRRGKPRKKRGPMPQITAALIGRRAICGACGSPGHNRRTCTLLNLRTPMSEEEKRKRSLAQKGRKRIYADDGTWHYGTKGHDDDGTSGRVRQPTMGREYPAPAERW